MAAAVQYNEEAWQRELTLRRLQRDDIFAQAVRSPVICVIFQAAMAQPPRALKLVILGGSFDAGHSVGRLTHTC